MLRNINRQNAKQTAQSIDACMDWLNIYLD